MQNDSSSNLLYLFIGLFIAAILIAGGVFYVKHVRPNNPLSTASSTPTLPGSTEITGSATVHEGGSSVPAPNYAAPLTFANSLSADVQQALNTQYAQIQSILAKDPTNFEAWIDLGIIRKTGGDYQGAAEDWTYITKIYPTSSVAFDDLGDLYMNFQKDYPKAESNLKQAIAVNAQDIGAYENLFALYTEYGYKAQTSAAADIMTQAIAKNPSSPDLHVLFARYYKSKGDTTNAKVQYDAAIKLAGQQGNQSLVTALTQEEAAVQ